MKTMIAFGLCFGLAGSARGSEGPLKCERVVFDVALTDGASADQTIVGKLCARGSIQHKTVQVLVHGGTYDHNYWDFPVQPETYSYVRAATAAGYATLNINRIGAGESSHPLPGGALSLHTAAFTLHQLVQTLRSGALKVHAFGHVRAERVMLVGHSMGSVASSIEAATWNDVDGVVLSAYAHSVGPGNDVAIASLYPAPLDPKFAAAGLDFDYFTTLPGTRGGVFYRANLANPAVIAADEVRKGTATIAELLDILPSLSLSPNIQAPTLIVVGNYDTFLCPLPSCTAAGFLINEPPDFGPHACAEAAIVPNAGHDVNLHFTAQTFFGIVREWADRRVGASSHDCPPQPCP